MDHIAHREPSQSECDNAVATSTSARTERHHMGLTFTRPPPLPTRAEPRDAAAGQFVDKQSRHASSTSKSPRPTRRPRPEAPLRYGASTVGIPAVPSEKAEQIYAGAHQHTLITLVHLPLCQLSMPEWCADAFAVEGHSKQGHNVKADGLFVRWYA